jgi:CIC family chloride channel protein
MKHYNKYIIIIISYFNIAINYGQQKLTHKQFIYLSASLVGASVGFASIVLKQLLHSIFDFISENTFFNSSLFYGTLPVIGILATVLLTSYLFRNKKLIKGLSGLLYLVHKRSGLVPRIQMYSQILTSSLTVGFGGSAGVEAPIVVTGAAFGSNYARRYKLSKKERMLLLAAGVAAGIGSAFNAPIAGVLFTLEVLTLDVTVSAFIPLIISAASGALISKIFLSENVILAFYHQKPFDYSNTFFYLILATFTGLFSVYHNRVFHKTEHLLSSWKISKFTKAILGGLLLSLIILVFPSLFGEGYAAIRWISSGNEYKLLNNSFIGNYFHTDWFIVLFALFILFLKPVATAITLGSGGNGGNFAPSLFVGGFLGFLVARMINLLFDIDLPESNFVMVGMAGILSGLYHAPLTAIFLIAEITGGYGLILPLMLVSSLSFGISKYFEPYSLDTKIFARLGEVISSNKDEQVLSGIHISEILDKNFHVLYENQTLKQVISILKSSKYSIFPVNDLQGNFVGVVTIDSMKEVLFENQLYDTLLVSQFLLKPEQIIDNEISIEQVLAFMDKYDYWFAPVVIATEFKGFVYKNDILTNYRYRLMNDIIE